MSNTTKGILYWKFNDFTYVSVSFWAENNQFWRRATEMDLLYDAYEYHFQWSMVFRDFRTGEKI